MTTPDHDACVPDAGAYVLGALDAGERAAFERHLRTCADCRGAVDELADVPALLDRVPERLVSELFAAAPGGAGGVPGGGGVGSGGAGGGPEGAMPVERDATGSGGVSPGLRAAPQGASGSPAPGSPEPPPRLLAELLRAARREETLRRRRRVLVGGLVAAAVVALAIVLPRALLDPVAPPPVAVEAIELEPVGYSPVTASVQLEQVPWGTRVTVTCRHSNGDAQGDAGATPNTDATPSTGDGYGVPQDADGTPGASGYAAGAGYALVIRDTAGGVEQVATWSAVPGVDVEVPGGTLLTRAQIASVELRAGDGTVVMRADAGRS
ncbi:zf-HC2 domain-containing protein [Actinotalea subterranea]|uniref:zf-HC2 domain-containing protein n=1 Tax=Actinotalea subterranea TaxID=2607497 RepID=UPI001CAA87FD|nr:zf-HC2 domain-containing protein [Actinotalea subterranea]